MRYISGCYDVLINFKRCCCEASIFRDITSSTRFDLVIGSICWQSGFSAALILEAAFQFSFCIYCCSVARLFPIKLCLAKSSDCRFMIEELGPIADRRC